MTTLDVTAAVTLLRAGGLVAFPTETVYGLGADASQAVAVHKIFRAKERPYDHPLIVHVATVEQLTDWACDISHAAKKLAQAFWPGPLTMVLKKQPQILDIVTGGQDTIGLRIPRHPIAQALLLAFGGGVAAPSANKFTHISPTTAAAVQEELEQSVDLVLDGGACTVGIESTIIDMSGDAPIILRPGIITTDQLAAVLGTQILSRRQGLPVLRAPGMHPVHYAPMTPMLVLAAARIPVFLQSLNKDDLPIALIAQSCLDLPLREHIHSVQMPIDAAAYAHDLYRTLRSLDNQHYKCILVEAVPDSPEWEAIRDRLNKASIK